ncbi:MAG: hypothetical protein M3409_10635 [Gemmatimonadota bacterium]|jgi:hypothetical protein|nr:hypothetical protein [Gemmatimonadota bacterium]
MGVRQWLKARMSEQGEAGQDLPPGTSLMQALMGREEGPVHALGEYNAQSYPTELSELLQRRQQVTDELLEIDVTDPEARIAAIPRLREMLRTYPHPLVYEMLVHAYVDADRFDEAKGVAFAARQRRDECTRSPHPEIRAETDRLHEWSSEEVEEMREARLRRRSRAGA